MVSGLGASGAEFSCSTRARRIGLTSSTSAISLAKKTLSYFGCRAASFAFYHTPSFLLPNFTEVLSSSMQCAAVITQYGAIPDPEQPPLAVQTRALYPTSSFSASSTSVPPTTNVLTPPPSFLGNRTSFFARLCGGASRRRCQCENQDDGSTETRGCHHVRRTHMCQCPVWLSTADLDGAAEQTRMNNNAS